jgi:nitrogen regulatory protein PII
MTIGGSGTGRIFIQRVDHFTTIRDIRKGN